MDLSPDVINWKKRSAPTPSYKDDTNLAEAPCPALCPPACPSAEEPRQLFCFCARVNQAHRLHSQVCIWLCVYPTPPQPPDTILLVFLGGTSDQMSKSPLVVLWFMKKNGTRLCAGWSNCSFGFKPLSLYAVREANMGFYAPLYMQYLYMYVQYVSFKSDSISLFSP